MIAIRAACLEDVRDVSKRSLIALPVDPESEDLRSLRLESCAGTLTLEGKPLACAGIQPLWPGVGHAWALLTPEAIEHGAVLSRAVRRGMAQIVERQKLHRVQATVQDGFDAGVRWLQWLGFEPEGFLVGYGAAPQRADYWMYARCFR